MPDEPKIEPANNEAKVPAKDTFRILIVDTIENTLQLKMACKEAGHSVVAAHKIDEAIAFLDNEDHADVIVCAAYLEDESMFDFLKQVRNNPIHKKSMFMILSLAPGPAGIVANSSTKAAGRLLGGNAFVSMPVFNAELLIDEVRKLLPLVPILEQERQRQDSDSKAT